MVALVGMYNKITVLAMLDTSQRSGRVVLRALCPGYDSACLQAAIVSSSSHPPQTAPSQQIYAYACFLQHHQPCNLSSMSGKTQYCDVAGGEAEL